MSAPEATGLPALNRDGTQPIYRQIKAFIENAIASGEWRAGRKLPSENELVLALEVSRMTINRALRELAQEGLIHRVHGVGSFVAEAPRHASLIELRDIAVEVREAGRRHRSQVLTLAAQPAEPEAAEQLGIEAASEVYYLEAVHFQDDTPIQFEARYVNPACLPAFIEQDFDRTTSTAWMLAQLRPDEMEHIVRAVVPDGRLCAALEIEPGDPCLQLARRTWKDGRVVTWATLTYPGSRYDLAARYATADYQIRQG